MQKFPDLLASEARTTPPYQEIIKKKYPHLVNLKLAQIPLDLQAELPDKVIYSQLVNARKSRELQRDLRALIESLRIDFVNLLAPYLEYDPYYAVLESILTRDHEIIRILILQILEGLEEDRIAEFLNDLSDLRLRLVAGQLRTIDVQIEELLEASELPDDFEKQMIEIDEPTDPNIAKQVPVIQYSKRVLFDVVNEILDYVYLQAAS